LYGVETVQKRPGMYIGPTDDGSGLHEMVFEVVANAINEGLAGYCSRIDVMLAANGAAIVSDDGRGIPVDIHHREGMSKAEFAMTRLHAAAFERDLEIPGTLHGVGLCVVNALSLWLDLRIWRDGAEHFMRFHDGHPTGALQVIGGSNGKRGTEITFLPNPRIFTGTSFDFATLEARFRELGSLGANVTLVLRQARRGQERSTDQAVATRLAISIHR
jgi:DNA gyrase subunit B